MPLAGKKSKRPASPNEGALSKKVGSQRFAVWLTVFVSAQPPCLQKSSKAGVPPLLPEGNRYADKNHPPWDGLKICQFAFLLPRAVRFRGVPCAAHFLPCTKSLPGHGEALVPPGNGSKAIHSTSRKRSIIMVIAEYTSPSGTVYRLIKEGTRVIAERQINEVWEEAGTYCGSDIYNTETAIIKIVGFMEDKNLYQLPWCAKPAPKIPTNPKAQLTTPCRLNKHQ